MQAENNRPKINFGVNARDPSNYYTYGQFVDGGCATDTSDYPPSTDVRVADFASCAQECINRVPDCSAFAFCASGDCKGNCNLYAVDPTKSNGYPGVTCGVLYSNGLYDNFGYLKGGCATSDNNYPPNMGCSTQPSRMHCEALCDTNPQCGSYDYNSPPSHCCLFKYDQKMTRSNGYPETTCTLKKITNVRGSWLKVGSVGGGGSFSQAISIGSQTTDGKTITETVGAQISAQVKDSCEFLGAGVEVTMSATASQSTAVSIASSLTKSKSVTTQATCPGKGQGGNTTTLYQWWVETDQAMMYTENFRCHYTTVGEQPPQCPYGFCGGDDLCQAEHCTPWQMSGPTQTANLIV